MIKTIRKMLKDVQHPLKPLNYRLVLEFDDGEVFSIASWEQAFKLNEALLKRGKIEGVQVDVTDNGVAVV